MKIQERKLTAEERLERLLELQGLLAQVSRDIGPALELQPVLTAVLRAMRSLVDFKGGTIDLVDELGVYVAASDPPVSPEVLTARVPVGTGLAGRVVATGEPVYSPDLDLDSRVDQKLRRLGSNVTMRSYLAVPLVCLGEVIGVLQVDSAEPDAFDVDDLRVLEGLAAQVAGAIESARRYEQVMELERLKSDFIARVSHELRTPLTVISGFASLLVSRGENLLDEQRTWLERIQAAEQRLGRLVEEILTFTTFEAGMAAVHATQVHVCDVLETVRERAFEPDRVAIACDPQISRTLDPKLLSHALSLLIDNALKYAGDAELSANLDAATGALEVAVTDHGPGVPRHLRERIFERFTRGEHTLPGMGLGLPLVRNLSAALGAAVELEDTPGGGARFVLRFP